MLSAIYGSRRPRRPPSALEQHRANRRSRPFRLAELGAWAARTSKDAGTAARSARAAHVPLVVRSSVSLISPGDLTWGGPLPIDWPKLLAAGCPDPRRQASPGLGELNRMAAPVVRRAFAADAGRRDRIVLVTSAGPAEGGRSSRSAWRWPWRARIRCCWPMPIRRREARSRSSVSLRPRA